ncbi:LAGLIDADG family homing endonuclease [Candidatus Woesearchaeota archaeon]|nr:LAGLIDADG family homing endonuclease [Candidatus Woesearchaeota archaeon]
MDFSKLLGYYQSESRKNKVRKRKGREFTFTNTSFKIIKDFTNLLRPFIDIGRLNTYIYSNNDLPKPEIEKVIKELIILGLNKDKIKVYKHIIVRKYSIMLRMENTLFSDIIDNILEKTKEYIMNEEDKYNEKLRVLFLRGLFNGDGTFFSIRDKHGSNHSWIKFFERDLPYVREYKKMLDQIGFVGRVRKDKNKNLYVLTVYLNWISLLKIFELELLKDKKNHHQRLLETIENHRWYKSHKHFTKLSQKFNGQNIRELMPKEICYSWVRKRIGDGTVKRIRIGNYQIMKEGIYIKNMLEKLGKERQHL